MNEGAFRGVILVGVAVVIGAILLANGLDDSSPVTIRDDGEAAGDQSPATAGDDTNTGTVLPNDSNPAEIPVVVANGSGVGGAAANVTALLVDLGYSPGTPVDTNPDAEPVALDTVYYLTSTRDFRSEAETVAESLGLTPESVTEMPDPPPADFGLAGVLVVLGSSGELAANTPAAPG